MNKENCPFDNIELDFSDPSVIFAIKALEPGNIVQTNDLGLAYKLRLMGVNVDLVDQE